MAHLIAHGLDAIGVARDYSLTLFDCDDMDISEDEAREILRGVGGDVRCYVPVDGEALYEVEYFDKSFYAVTSHHRSAALDAVIRRTAPFSPLEAMVKLTPMHDTDTPRAAAQAGKVWSFGVDILSQPCGVAVVRLVECDQ